MSAEGEPEYELGDGMTLGHHLRERAAKLPGFLALYLGGTCLTILGVSVCLLLLVPALLVGFLQAPVWHFLNEAPMPRPLEAMLHASWHWGATAVLAVFLSPVAWYVSTTAALVDSSILALWEGSVLFGYNLAPGGGVNRTLAATPVWALLHGLTGVLGIRLFVMIMVWIKLEA